MFDKRPPNIVEELGAVQAYEPDEARATEELVTRARDRGGNAIYNIGPLLGPGCGSPTGPQDTVIIGWGATVAVVNR